MDESRPMGFAGGYITHLLTDYLWWEAVIDPFRKKLSPTLPEEDFRSLYYRETDQIDLDLYHQMPWRPEAWSRLEMATTADFASLLTAEEIIQWRDRTLLWYEDPSHDPMVEPVYITRANTQTFIERTVKEIAGIFADMRGPLYSKA